MTNQTGNISIHAQNIMPIIKRWLYSDKDIFFREMVSNGCDAITKEKMLHPGEERDYRVTVTLDEKAGELRFSDNGIGMTAEEVEKYINQVAFSGAEEFLKNYEGEEKGGIIGHFGLGFYSAFMVADKVTIETLSGSEGAAPVRWVSEDGMAFTMEEGSRTERGTDIILHIAQEEKEFLEEYRAREVLKRYCGFMATPVYFDVVKEEPAVSKAEGEEEAKPEEPKGPELINATQPLWLKAPKDCTEDEYKQFYRDVFHTYEDPLFYVHLNVDYPFNLKGILYFPKLTNDFGTREGEIKLFSGQVFVADNIKEVIPEFLMLLKGVIDCPDLPLNVSRSFLQNDGYVKKLSAYITRKVADKLTGLFNTERENYQKYWDDIHPFVKYGCMRDGKFFDQVKDTLLYKTTKDTYYTLQEYLSKNEGRLGKKVVYTNDPTRQSASVAMYDAEGIDVVVMDALIDLNFVSFMEYSAGVDGLKFARVDADSDTFTKELSEEEKKQNEEKEQALAELFKAATGKEDLAVKLSALKDEALPAMLTQEEQGRRFSEMSRIYGQDFKMPEMHTLVLNASNAVVKSLMQAEAGEKRDLMAAQLYDLARMSTRPLEKDEVTAFLNRSNKLLELLADSGR
ncbi:MAG: molecular chaperone HtpG [Clostridiales bacterium]|nr:molecular chaperone HtpG [Clostridiales bacterium]MDO4349708.1 molecular chaperone HtpG [Eubacteriales bacterium]MDY4007342.1 molecular chaperone HtpG [Candidatus Limiplasma sp.]